MSDAIEIQVEELKAELRNACDRSERQRLRSELTLAQAELAVILAEQLGDVDPEPPF